MKTHYLVFYLVEFGGNVTPITKDATITFESPITSSEVSALKTKLLEDERKKSNEFHPLFITLTGMFQLASE